MRKLKTIIFITFILNLVVNAQDTSLYKKSENIWTDEENDYHEFNYENMRVYVNYTKVYVYDMVDFTHKSRSFPSNYDHYILYSTDGTINEDRSKNYSIWFNNINPGDTLQVVSFQVDSMQGTVAFNKYMFLGMKREENVNTQNIEESEAISIYPNPTNDKINISEMTEPFSYVLYDMKGIAVIGGNPTSNTIDLWFLEKGEYILNIRSNDKSYSTKIIKN